MVTTPAGLTTTTAPSVALIVVAPLESEQVTPGSKVRDRLAPLLVRVSVEGVQDPGAGNRRAMRYGRSSVARPSATRAATMESICSCAVVPLIE
jgi:hypothetical protein